VTVSDEPHTPAQLRRALIEALGDPLRVQVLSRVADRPGATIAQIAARIRESPRRVRHQIDRLLEAGLVAIDAETPRRNAHERHYRALSVPSILERGDDSWTDDERRRVALSVARMMVSDIVRAGRQQTFGIHPGHAEVRIPGEADATGWAELGELMVRTTEQAERTMERSAARLRSAGEPGREIIVGLLLFEGPSWGPASDGPSGPRPTLWSTDEGSG
jgi:DNA-binding transcriptional ArsR family regulator